jgi:protein-tyrosine phosphatase
MVDTWEDSAPGVMRLPSGLVVRGRGLSREVPEGPDPEFGLYLLRARPAAVAWRSRWVRWPDFGSPTDHHDAADAIREAWRRAGTERVEVACRGGKGRTGTALACIAVLDGVPADEAVTFVRRHYHPRAVETVIQRRYVRRFVKN